jgi:hypothetical protein
MIMDLWYISQHSNTNYDTYDAAIVAAETEREARETHPGGEKGGRDTWVVPNLVSVELIGTAKPFTKPGVILASYR